MPRPNQFAKEFIAGGNCKVRKRFVQSSSSSSSSALRNRGLKRAVSVNKRGGLSTPFPVWKMDSNSPSSTVGASSEFCQQPRSNDSVSERQGPVSARKLANALWELQRMPSPTVRGESQRKRCNEEGWRVERKNGSCLSGSLPSHLSDPLHSPAFEAMNRSGSGLHRRRMQWSYSRKQRFHEREVGIVDSSSFGSVMEIEAHSRGPNPRIPSRGIKSSSLRDLKKGLNASMEYLKIVDHFCGLGKHKYPHIASVYSALSTELERARILVDQLIEEHRREGAVVGLLCKRQMNENAMWKRREQEKIREGVRFLLKELEIEKKTRRRIERQNEELIVELNQTKVSFSKTSHDLESERKSREVIEHVCNELVRGIGKDKADVEEMKRKSTKVREELEREREMLQLANSWREERAHTKLTEAKFQLEEKNAVVDQLRNDLEAFLVNQRSSCDSKEKGTREVDLELIDPRPVNWERGHIACEKIRDKADEDNSEVDTIDSDLHSIEINMDNESKGYSWSFAKRDVLQGMDVSYIYGDDEGIHLDHEALTKNSFSASKGTEWPFDARRSSDMGGSKETSSKSSIQMLRDPC